MAELRVPDIGDFKDVEVIEVLVKPGDAVAAESGIITLETDKATMEIPAPQDGTITALNVALGDKVNEGDLIGTLAITDAPIAAPAAPATPVIPDAPVVPANPAPVPVVPAAPATATPVTDSTPLKVVVPDIGDFADVEVIGVLVKPGDTVAMEDSLITLETDKATMDVPAPQGGTVNELLVKQGDKVSQGTPIAVLTPAAGNTPAAMPPVAPTTAVAPSYAAAPAISSTPKPPPATTPPKRSSNDNKTIYASPSVRKVSREFGVDLNQVKGSGPLGRILKEDVQAYVRDMLAKGSGGGAGLDLGYKFPALDLGDLSQFGPVEEVKLSRIRQISGPTLHRNWLQVAHVTQFDEADVTDLEDFRKAHVSEAKARGFSLSPLAFLIKAVTTALREFPEFNSSLLADGTGIVIKKYYNIGVAVATLGGLMVPVLKGTDAKSVMQLAEELGSLSALTRAGKVGPKNLRGGSFTISSLGGIGGTHFTPIVNLPEVAILGVGKVQVQPVWDGKTFLPRKIMPLSLSYDHRVIDGAQGASFISKLTLLLSDIRNIVL